MTLFGFDPQHREKRAIWRLFEMSELRWGMADGRIFRWFAANVPLNLEPNTGFEGDLDLVACLRHGRGAGARLIYRTWEVKVAIIDKEGRPRALKAGKTDKLLGQMRKYRQFGCPEVSLLEMYVCEDGTLARHGFPPAACADAIRAKMAALAPEQFGYHILPFEHAKDGDVDGYVRLYRHRDPLEPAAIPLLFARRAEPALPFISLIEQLNKFAEGEFVAGHKPGFMVILYCRACRRLLLQPMKGECYCRHCGEYLVTQ